MTEGAKRGPDYAGDGIAVWVNQTKDGKTYLTVKKPEWGQGIPCFKNEPKTEKKPQL